MLLAESFHLARLTFFKPFKLDEELKQNGLILTVSVPLWPARKGLGAKERRAVRQALVFIALMSITWPLVGGLSALWLREFHWQLYVLAMGMSLSVGTFGLGVAGISFGVNLGTAVSLVSGFLTFVGVEPFQTLVKLIQSGEIVGVINYGLWGGLALGLILGLAAAATFTSRPATWWFGGICAVTQSVLLSSLVAQVAGQKAGDVALTIILAVFFALGFLLGYMMGRWRLPLYLIELTWQGGITGLSFLAMRVDASGRLLRRLYQVSPITMDELVWFPLWTLDRQLIWLALRGDRPFALQAIVKIAHSFRQSWAAEAALAAILAHDLRDCQSIPDVAAAGAYLRWLPRTVDLPSLPLQQAIILLNEVTQNAEAANRALDNPGWGINLRKARNNLDALGRTLARADRRVSNPLSNVVTRWKESIEQALNVLQDAGPGMFENPYITGYPIQADQERMFVGREDLFAQIQENLEAIQKPTLVLHGQRRTGKSSLLLQLPNRLPADYVPIYVDLQKTAPVDGLNRFLYTLAREAVQQADEKRHIVLSAVDLEDFDRRGTHAFFEWLDRTKKQLDGRLLFFALDEFEKIDEAVEEGRLEAGVLDILRHLIQHHSQWLVLLFAGIRTLEQMSRNWHSYFISVRPIRVSYLSPEAVRQLILLPTQSHPISYDSAAVEEVMQATHAQPFLAQAVCFELIQHLNRRERRSAGPYGRVTVADIRESIHQAMRSATPYFQDLWLSSDDTQRLVLAGLAHGQEEWMSADSLSKSLDLEPAVVFQVLEQLKGREIVEQAGQESRFQVPLVRQWIREEKSLEAVQVATQPPPKAAHKRR